MKMEPSADMRQTAHVMRELFVALLDEGFTESQALTLLSRTVAASMARNNEGDA